MRKINKEIKTMKNNLSSWVKLAAWLSRHNSVGVILPKIELDSSISYLGDNSESHNNLDLKENHN